MQRYAWIALVLALALSPILARPALAEDIGKKMEREYGVVDRSTTEGRRFNDRLSSIVRRTSKALGYTPRSAKLLGGRRKKTDKVINAFALGDGRIYVTLGLMRLVDQDPDAEAQIAFVVGHELTHVTQRHVRHQQNKARNAGIAAAVIGILTRDRTAATAARLGASAYVSSYGRRDEYRADRGGLKAMYGAGYNLDAAVSMLQHLKEQGGKQDKFINGLFGSHPITGNRINRIKKQTADIRAGRDTPIPSEKELRRQEKEEKKKARAERRRRRRGE